MPALDVLPPWNINYSYDARNAISRSSVKGKQSQNKISNRQIMRASAQRLLSGDLLPYFEYFIREVCLDGAKKFEDIYTDGNGNQQGMIRLVNGRYTVSARQNLFLVECEIEVFR